MQVHNPNNLPTIPIADLLPTQGNLKDLTEKNYSKLKNTIERRGFSVPVYVWEDDKGIKHLLDGHQRRQVLTTEGWNDPIPYLKVPANDLQEAMARLLEITSQYATITQDGIDEFMGKYDLNEAEVYEATSFDAVGKYGDAEEVEVEEDEAPEVETGGSAVSVPGTVYQLGRHRVMCGSATDLDAVAKLADNNKVDLILTDPPYNMAYTGSATARREAIINDKIDNFGEFVNDFMASMVAVAKSSAPYYVFTSEPEVVTIKEGFVTNGLKPSQTIIWKKHRIGFGGADYQHQYEPLVYGWKSHKERYMVDKRNLSDVWEFSRPHRSDEHPTMKPIELLAHALHNSSKSDDIVLDLFLGSGSTLIACEQTDRTCYGMELDPKYTDVIRRRYWKFVNNGDETGWEENTPAIDVK